jgi:hypothetical protein
MQRHRFGLSRYSDDVSVDDIAIVDILLRLELVLFSAAVFSDDLDVRSGSHGGLRLCLRLLRPLPKTSRYRAYKPVFVVDIDCCAAGAAAR